MKRNYLISSADAFLLSPEERLQPGAIFSELFEAYQLHELRQRIRDLLDSALHDRDCDAQSYFFLFRQLERLIEAVYLVHVSAPQKSGATVNDHTLNDNEEVSYKPPRIDELAALRPTEAAEKLFTIRTVDELLEDLDAWKRCLLTSTHGFHEASQRENLWNFCDQLGCLVESVHLYQSTRHLSELTEMENFFNFFTLTYTRRELWDCFEAVIQSECNAWAIEPADAVKTYLCLLAVAITAFHLTEESSKWTSAAKQDEATT